METNQRMGDAKATKWAGIYSEWKTSKQRQAAYCESRGIKGWEFKLGIRAAREAGLIAKTDRPPRGKGNASSSFVPIRVRETPSSGGPYCEIRFNGSAGIRIETRESIGQLRELIRGMWQ
jgi:hypothetical protein